MPKSMSADQKRRARAFLGRRDGWKCFYCGMPLIPDNEREKYTTRTYQDKEILYIPIDGYDFPTIDHIQPLSKGGTNHISNCVLCCNHCNCKKNDKWQGVY